MIIQLILNKLIKMEELIVASHNQNKCKEIQALLSNTFMLKTLDDIGISEDIPENEFTFEGNAKAKTSYVVEKTGKNCFADDSGLEVLALNNEPGVFSARYAGLEKNEENNLQLLLKNLKGIENRAAAFKTSIVLYYNGTYYHFEGEVKGRIISEKRGKEGFGYDPIFIPEGSDKTFAEMNLEEKNRFSHRARALEKMLHFLTKNA